MKPLTNLARPPTLWSGGRLDAGVGLDVAAYALEMSRDFVADSLGFFDYLIENGTLLLQFGGSDVACFVRHSGEHTALGTP